MFDAGDHCPVIHCQQPLIVMQPDWLFVTQLLPFEPFWYELKQNYHWLYISSKLSKLYHCNTGITRFTRASVSVNRREVILKRKVIWNIALDFNFRRRKTRHPCQRTEWRRGWGSGWQPQAPCRQSRPGSELICMQQFRWISFLNRFSTSTM